MTDLYDALLTDALPAVIRSQPWARAMSVAIRAEVRRIMDLAGKMLLYTALPDMPDDILDIMAAELHVMNYDQAFTASVKRALILGAMSYWSTAGTRSATESACRAIFGDADIVEWFDEAGGTPGTFKISTTNPSVTAENVAAFRAAVTAVKRLSAQMEDVELSLSVPPVEVNAGFFLSTCTLTTLTVEA